MERMQRQSAIHKAVFGEPEFDPPPYPFSHSRSQSAASSSTTQSLAQDKPLPLAPSSPPQYSQIDHAGAKIDVPALPKDSLVLVTGANGWQAMHVVDQLIEHGYRVRGTVRDAEKTVRTGRYFKDKYGPGKYMTAVVPDMVPKGAFDIAARGCSGVVHVASVMTFSPDPDEVVTPSIAGALNALEAAAKEPNVKRFVYCSAAAAAVAQGTGMREDVTNESWNMSALKTAWEPPPYDVERAWAVFSSSKMQAEQTVWRWYRARRPQFVLNTVLPSMLWGKMLDPQNQGYSSSVAQLKLIFDGNAAATAWAPPQYFVDVQDSALLHVAALILPDVRGQRIFAAESPYNIDSVLQLLRGLYPDKVFEGDVSDHGADLTVFKDAPKAVELLRRMGQHGWTDMETSVSRNCEALF
ncbi:hypothetical protein LTR85_008487 [Meristemomyces frigidus]|nr:hypothetical protein LTR85_008487 [Meristemomyces frigidus]